MASLKTIDRSAFVAMSPDSPFMATGTMAGAIDLSFSSSANLDIFELDFSFNDRVLKPVGQCSSPERFNRIAWGSYGLIAGGLVDGNIGLWNPNSLISSESNESVHVRHLSKHKGPVRALEFNVKVPNKLASGSDDGTVCIWDLANSSEPCHLSKGTGSLMQSEIASVSWNREFQHVLASTSYNGTTVIWDVNNEKVITDFKNFESNDRFKGPVRCSVLQWDPDNTSQIMIASDEDSSPIVKLMDIRYLQSPVRTFVGHQRGVTAMEWCPSDSLYLLTCGKDNRTILWNTKTAEIVTELPSGNNWNFDVHWCPKFPGVISASSVDGTIGIYNLEGCGRNGIEENNLDSAPKWWKRPVGASFGFGGKLVSFNSKLPYASEVFLHSLATEQSLVSQISKFEAAIENGEKTSLRGFCEMKSEETESEEEKETWSLLKIMLEEDGTLKTKLRTKLGYSLPSEENDQAVNEPNATKCPENVEEIQEMPEREEESSDSSFDDAIQRSLVIGDYKGAVAQCLSANKMADALVIAHIGGTGTSLWESTRNKYLKLSNAPYMKVVSAILNNDLMSLVNTRPPKLWKETLALICTFAEGDEWTSLCDALATNLMASDFTLAATLSYICAGNVDKAVEIWSSSLGKERDEKSYAERVQDLMEKTLVLSLATGNKRFSATLHKLFESYAEILASQGLVSTAMKLLKVLDSGDFSPQLSNLLDQLALSAEPEPVNICSSGNTQPEIAIRYNKEPTHINSYDHSPYQQQYTTPYPSYVHLISMFTPHQVQPVPQKYLPRVQVSNAQLSVRPMVPIQQVTVQPSPAPQAPPPTVHTADTSNVPAHQKPIVATLTRLYKETSEALGQANPAKKREIEDNSRKLGALFSQLNNGDISKEAAEKLVQLCQALDRHDFSAALQIQVLMTTAVWDECNFWLVALKRMIKGSEKMILSYHYS